MSANHYAVGQELYFVWCPYSSRSGRGGDQRLAPNSSAEGRVMRLRGYGNAIVPQVAEAFIRASGVIA